MGSWLASREKSITFVEIQPVVLASRVITNQSPAALRPTASRISPNCRLAIMEYTVPGPPRMFTAAMLIFTSKTSFGVGEGVKVSVEEGIGVAVWGSFVGLGVIVSIGWIVGFISARAMTASSVAVRALPAAEIPSAGVVLGVSKGGKNTARMVILLMHRPKTTRIITPKNHRRRKKGIAAPPLAIIS